MVEYIEARQLDSVFNALRDPTRRAILRSLSHGSSTIKEIAKPFPLSFNAISKHVMVLESAGLLRREVRGREHHCWIQSRPLRDANQWLEHYRQFWEERMDALEIYVAKKAKVLKKGTAHGRLH